MPWRWRARCPSTRPTAVRALSKVRSCVVRWLCRTWRSIRYAAASLLLSTSRIVLSLRARGGGRLPGGAFRLSQGCGSIVRALLCYNPDVTVLYVTVVIYEKGANCYPCLWLYLLYAPSLCDTTYCNINRFRQASCLARPLQGDEKMTAV